MAQGKVEMPCHEDLSPEFGGLPTERCLSTQRDTRRLSDRAGQLGPKGSATQSVQTSTIMSESTNSSPIHDVQTGIYQTAFPAVCGPSLLRDESLGTLHEELDQQALPTFADLLRGHVSAARSGLSAAVRFVGTP